MATLLENKNRIVSAFNAIRANIITKGQITTNSVASYADAIRLIGTDKFLGGRVIKSAFAQPSSVPYTLTMDTYTHNSNKIKLLVFCGVSIFSNPANSCVIKINNVEVPSQQPTIPCTYWYSVSSSSSSASVDNYNYVGLTPITLEYGQRLDVSLTHTANTTYNNGMAIIVFSCEDTYILKWASALSSYGSFLNELSPASTTTTKYGYKQIRYYDISAQDWRVVSPYTAGSITLGGENSTVKLQAYAGNHTSRNSFANWYSAIDYHSGSYSGNSGALLENQCSLYVAKECASHMNKEVIETLFGSIYVVNISKKYDTDPSEGSYNWTVEFPTQTPA